MIRYLLDTNAAADAIFRRRGVPERVKTARADGHDVGIGIPALGELYAGAEYSDSRDHNLGILRRSVKLFRLWPFTSEAAEVYGSLYAKLRRKGRTMQQVDLQIAAIATVLGQCIVVSEDSDLAAIPGLSVENWALRKGE